MNDINHVGAIRAIDRVLQTPKTSLKDTREGMLTYARSESDNWSKKYTLREEDYSAIVDEAKEALQQVSTALTFRIHEKTGRPLIQLVEIETEKVIREIPPEKMLDILAGIWDWAGLLVDRKE